MGIETHCFAWEKGAVAKEIVDCFYPISVTEKEQILNECLKIGIDGVVSAASPAIPTAAYIARKMGLNGNPTEVAEQIGNKKRTRDLTDGIETLTRIPYQLVTDVSTLERMKLPVVLKPVLGGGKAGLSVIRESGDVKKAYDYAVSSGYTSFMAEEYIEGGKEYSVESLSFHGVNYILQITDKESGGPPHCVELAHHQPAALSDVMWKRVETAVDSVLKALGILNGPCHTEIKIVNDKIYLIEVNGRLAGGHIAHPLVELSTGYPYLEGVIKVALNQDPMINVSALRKEYASVFFVTRQTEHLKPIFDECEKHKWCYQKFSATEELVDYEKNDGYRTNYFIYHSLDCPPPFRAIKNG